MRRDDPHDTGSRADKGEDPVAGWRAAQVPLEAEQVRENDRDHQVTRVRTAQSHRDETKPSRTERARPGSLNAMGTDESASGSDAESRVEVYITTDTSGAPHKADEPKLYVMYDAAKPESGKLYFTEAEWDAFVLGVKDGEFDLDEDGNLPPLPAEQQR